MDVLNAKIVAYVNPVLPLTFQMEMPALFYALKLVLTALALTTVFNAFLDIS
jgi:hypothetical protein